MHQVVGPMNCDIDGALLITVKAPQFNNTRKSSIWQTVGATGVSIASTSCISSSLVWKFVLLCEVSSPHLSYLVRVGSWLQRPHIFCLCRTHLGPFWLGVRHNARYQACGFVIWVLEGYCLYRVVCYTHSGPTIDTMPVAPTNTPEILLILLQLDDYYDRSSSVVNYGTEIISWPFAFGKRRVPCLRECNRRNDRSGRVGW
jgi:hypothetical protein